MTIRQTDGPTHDEWLASMARTTSAAAVVMYDEDMRMLLLHATYEDSWQLPGGTVEHGQSPWQAAVREVAEETGHHLTGGPHLLGIDWYRPDQLDPYAQFLFVGPRINSSEFSVTLSDEHDAWQLKSVEEWKPLIGPAHATRLTAFREAIHSGRPVYLHDGHVVH